VATTAIVDNVRCPGCGRDDDKVVDSRTADDGLVIRRRRECLSCSRRYTTYERLEEVLVSVVKRDGSREAFDRSKIVSGLRSATKNLPIDRELIEQIATDIEEAVRLDATDIPSERIGLSILERLRYVDAVAYIRFASVYKGFTDLGDFTREVKLLGKTQPKDQNFSG
jgi:transcriptional repressor NrdR